MELTTTKRAEVIKMNIAVIAPISPAKRRLMRKRRTGIGTALALKSATMVNPIIRPATTVTTASRMEKAKKPGLLMDPSFSCSKVELFILAKGKLYYSQPEAFNLYSSVCSATAVVTGSFILLNT